jgi:hypothetical protein
MRFSAYTLAQHPEGAKEHEASDHVVSHIGSSITVQCFTPVLSGLSRRETSHAARVFGAAVLSEVVLVPL